jgi:hypothetical protein
VLCNQAAIQPSSPDRLQSRKNRRELIVRRRRQIVSPRPGCQTSRQPLASGRHPRQPKKPRSNEHRNVLAKSKTSTCESGGQKPPASSLGGRAKNQKTMNATTAIAGHIYGPLLVPGSNSLGRCRKHGTFMLVAGAVHGVRREIRCEGADHPMPSESCLQIHEQGYNNSQSAARSIANQDTKVGSHREKLRSNKPPMTNEL